MYNKRKKIIATLLSWIFAFVASAGLIAFTLQVVAVFEMEMLKRLIIPIAIVALPFYVFFKKSLFKN